MISRWVCVSCNHCGRPAGGTEDLRATAVEARRIAAAWGWKRLRDAAGDMKDICPACQRSEAPA